MNKTGLHQAARQIFTGVLRAVDAENAVRRAIKSSADGNSLKITGETFDFAALKNISAVAVGKAAFPMAAALDEILTEKLSGGIISGVLPDEKSRALSNTWQIFAGGHPLPNEASIEAAKSSFALLEAANDENSLVIFLISGGGSAMFELPAAENITLADLRRANEILVHCGASISEINYLRRAFSRVKGGGLARIAVRAAQISLLISDTESGDEKSIASGLTFESPPTEFGKIRHIIEKYALDSKLPASIRQVLAIRKINEKKNHPTENLSRNYVLLDNRKALEAAKTCAAKFGFRAEIVSEIESQSVAEGCRLLLEKMRETLKKAGENEVVCLISGGEFSCPVRGDGTGGRNSETALQMAVLLDEIENECAEAVFLSAGTDGIDGSSPSAGAICDTRSLKKAHALKIDAHDFLDRSDSYSFFKLLNDAVVTGATGTNVRDLRLLLARK